MTRKKTNAVRAKRHPTLVDIAGIAGVAPMTVSRVINQSGYVSEEVRKRVQGAIEKLEYHPNALARSQARFNASSSPTMPRRNDNTQATKIAPMMAVTQPPTMSDR